MHLGHVDGEGFKIKWTSRITNNDVFQRVKRESLFLKILQI